MVAILTIITIFVIIAIVAVMGFCEPPGGLFVSALSFSEV